MSGQDESKDKGKKKSDSAHTRTSGSPSRRNPSPTPPVRQSTYPTRTKAEQPGPFGRRVSTFPVTTPPAPQSRLDIQPRRRIFGAKSRTPEPVNQPSSESSVPSSSSTPSSGSRKSPKQGGSDGEGEGKQDRASDDENKSPKAKYEAKGKAMRLLKELKLPERLQGYYNEVETMSETVELPVGGLPSSSSGPTKYLHEWLKSGELRLMLDLFEEIREHMDTIYKEENLVVGLTKWRSLCRAICQLYPKLLRLHAYDDSRAQREFPSEEAFKEQIKKFCKSTKLHGKREEFETLMGMMEGDSNLPSVESIQIHKVEDIWEKVVEHIKTSRVDITKWIEAGANQTQEYGRVLHLDKVLGVGDEKMVRMGLAHETEANQDRLLHFEKDFVKSVNRVLSTLKEFPHFVHRPYLQQVRESLDEHMGNLHVIDDMVRQNNWKPRDSGLWSREEWEWTVMPKLGG